MNEAARRAGHHAARPGQPLVDMIQDFMQGKPINVADFGNAAAQAIHDMAQAFIPDIGHIPREAFDPTRGWDGTSQHDERTPPRQPDPDPAELEIRRARQVMGFGPTVPLTPEEIKVRQRELAMKHHPDRGGKLEKMQAINAAADLLLQEL